MANFYCEYCGQKYPTVGALTAISCPRHPAGFNCGKHKLYEGGEKSKYTCKYCGATQSVLGSLVSIACSRHPNGFNKGKHSPAL